MNVVVLTNDKALWALRPFAHLFNKFWSAKQAVEVVGFNRPSFDLPRNFSFFSVDETNWPADRWTDQLIYYLEQATFRHFVLMLEDYWLDRSVDTNCVDAMWHLASKALTNTPLLRIDLTADRASHKDYLLRSVDYNGYQVISTRSDAPYQMSYQAAIWDRKALLGVLFSGENPWQSEIEGSKRLEAVNKYWVLGTRHHPVHYVPVLRRGKVGLQKFEQMPEAVREEIRPLIPKEMWHG